MGFGVWGLGFGVWGLGFGVWGLGFGVWGVGCGVGMLPLILTVLNRDYNRGTYRVVSIGFRGFGSACLGVRGLRLIGFRGFRVYSRV